MRILILCTGNSCRSQMAEGFLKSFDKSIEVFSAGTNPSSQVHPKAIEVMREINIDISSGFPKKVDRFIDSDFDYVITVCDNARETCPVFTGNVRHMMHISFDDPAVAAGTESNIMAVFRRVRDEMKEQFSKLYMEKIKGNC